VSHRNFSHQSSTFHCLVTAQILLSTRSLFKRQKDDIYLQGTGLLRFAFNCFQPFHYQCRVTGVTLISSRYLFTRQDLLIVAFNCFQTFWCQCLVTWSGIRFHLDFYFQGTTSLVLAFNCFNPFHYQCQVSLMYITIISSFFLC